MSRVQRATKCVEPVARAARRARRSVCCANADSPTRARARPTNHSRGARARFDASRHASVLCATTFRRSCAEQAYGISTSSTITIQANHGRTMDLAITSGSVACSSLRARTHARFVCDVRLEPTRADGATSLHAHHAMERNDTNSRKERSQADGSMVGYALTRESHELHINRRVGVVVAENCQCRHTHHGAGSLVAPGSNMDEHFNSERSAETYFTDCSCLAASASGRTSDATYAYSCAGTLRAHLNDASAAAISSQRSSE